MLVETQFATGMVSFGTLIAVWVVSTPWVGAAGKGAAGPSMPCAQQSLQPWLRMQQTCLVPRPLPLMWQVCNAQMWRRYFPDLQLRFTR